MSVGSSTRQTRYPTTGLCAAVVSTLLFLPRSISLGVVLQGGPQSGHSSALRIVTRMWAFFAAVWHIDVNEDDLKVSPRGMKTESPVAIDLKRAERPDPPRCRDSGTGIPLLIFRLVVSNLCLSYPVGPS